MTVTNRVINANCHKKKISTSDGTGSREILESTRSKSLIVRNNTKGEIFEGVSVIKFDGYENPNN